MKILANRRLLGLMLAPFALFTACVGLTPEEQAEFKELQEEVQRIEVEELQPRQDELNRIIDGKLVVNVKEIQEQVNQIRNEKIEPLNKKLAAMKSGEFVLAAPGTRIELEELNRRLDELLRLYAGMQAQIEQHRVQLKEAKNVAGQELEAQISLLKVELKGLLADLEQLGQDTDISASKIDESLNVLRTLLITLVEDSADADDTRAAIAALEAEWDVLHASELVSKAELDAAVEVIEAKIAALREEISARHDALAEQFGILIQGLEVSLHDISEEKQDVVRTIHELELSAPEELEKTIDELESVIEDIITSELRPLIERLNAATNGGDLNAATREQLRAEIEAWLAKITSLRARMNDLTAKSFQSLIGSLNLGSFGLGQ